MHKSQQTTLSQPLLFCGIGVHSGAPAQMRLLPTKAGAGIMVRQMRDASKMISIGLVVPEVAMHATVLCEQGWRVSTIEHVMAALGMMGIDNAIIELDGDEIPILDGSALPFAQEIQRVGVASLSMYRQFLTPKEELEFKDSEGRSIVISPAKHHDDGTFDTNLYVNYSAHFEHPLVGSCTLQGMVTPEFFLNSIAPARTFGFLHQLPVLRKHGLAQGTTLGNTVVIAEHEFLNELRFDDEFVRHKVLDLLGDLALLGKPLAGSVKAHKTGHSFNRVVVQHYINHPEAWQIIE